MEQFIAELEVFVGERTQKERTELLGLKEVDLKRLIKYARLADLHKEQQIYKEQQTAVKEQEVEPAPKQRKK